MTNVPSRGEIPAHGTLDMLDFHIPSSPIRMLMLSGRVAIFPALAVKNHVKEYVLTENFPIINTKSRKTNSAVQVDCRNVVRRCFKGHTLDTGRLKSV